MDKGHKMDMTEGALLPKILLFSIPLMLSSMLQLLFNALDIVVVGKFAGDTSLAAVSSTSALVHLVTNIFIGLSIGSNVVVAKYIGENHKQDVYESVHTSMMLSIITGIICSILGFFGSTYMLQLMKTPDNVIGLSSLYLKIYFLGSLANMVYNFGAAVLKAYGDTKRPLYYLFAAGVANALLNLLFVIVFKMDVAGVGLATIMSQYLSAFLVVNCLVKEKSDIHLDLKQMRLYGDKLWSIIKIGVPSGIQGSMFSISNVVIQSSINSFGSIIMAGSGAASNIEGFVYMAMNAFYQACLTFVGQNYGAHKYERINKILLTCLGCVLVVGLAAGVGAYLAGPVLVGIYSSDPEVIEAGCLRLFYVCQTYVLCGLMDTFVGCLRGLGKSIIPMLITLIGVCGYRLLWVATVFKKTQTIITIYMSYPISWILALLALIVYYIFVKKGINKEVVAY